jgi:hypothetical protein
LKADARRIASAPVPSSVARQKLREEISQLAQRGEVDVSPLIEHEDGRIAWPMLTAQARVFNAGPGSTAFSEILDTAGLLASIFSAALIEHLDAKITAESDDKAALSSEAREVALAEVAGDLLQVERELAALTFAAQQAGHQIEHAADADPRALLGIALVTVPRGETPGTSAGLSWPLRR